MSLPSQIKNSQWVYIIENPNIITIDKINSDEYIHDNFENIVSYKFINEKCGTNFFGRLGISNRQNKDPLGLYYSDCLRTCL